MRPPLVNAAPTPQFGVPWRKGSLGETLLADMRPSESAAQSASASATLAGGEIISRTFPAAAATQSFALYQPGNNGVSLKLVGLGRVLMIFQHAAGPGTGEWRHLEDQGCFCHIHADVCGRFHSGVVPRVIARARHNRKEYMSVH